MRRHQHDAIDPTEGCPACDLLVARMLVFNALDVLTASMIGLENVEKVLGRLDPKGLKNRRKEYSEEEIERRRAHGRALGARVKKALKGDK